jgi:hypothetical protein
MEIFVNDNKSEIIALMKQTGAIEVKDELID